MRITRSRVCLAGLICAVALAFVPLSAAEEGRADDQLLVVVYPIADLPVWSITGEKGKGPTFDPSLLKTLITTAIDPESWSAERGFISQHETTNSLVVRQTRTNHQRLSELLADLRPAHPQEEVDHLGLQSNE